MYDVEMVISARIERWQKFTNPKSNAAMVRMHEVEIKTLQIAPRNDHELERLLESKKRFASRMNNLIAAQSVHAEIASLQWLLHVVKLKDSYHTEDGMV